MKKNCIIFCVLFGMSNVYGATSSSATPTGVAEIAAISGAIRAGARASALSMIKSLGLQDNPKINTVWTTKYPGGESLATALAAVPSTSTLSTSAPATSESATIKALGSTVTPDQGKTALKKLFTDKGESGNELLVKIYAGDAGKVAAAIGTALG